MKYLPTGEEMKYADRFTIDTIGLPSMVLMERAAMCVVDAVEREGMDVSKPLILCGAGNNGGDGYAVARLLKLKGHDVEILFLGKESSRSAENRKQMEIASYYNIPMHTELPNKKYSMVIDALFGTGLTRDVTGAYANVLEAVNAMSCCKLAVDVPSGVNDTTGKIMGTAFRADYTVAIAFVKRGLVFYPAQEYAGKVIVGDIGIMPDALKQDAMMTYHYEWDDLCKRYPKRSANSHKGSHGKVLLIVGSKGMSGASYLSARAAYEVGAGLVQIYTDEANREILQKLLPEAIITTYTTYDETVLHRLLTWADVIGIGSGLGTSELAVCLVKQTLQQASVPCIVDADAINILAQHQDWMNCQSELVLTPHMKEMSRLTGYTVKELQGSRIELLNELTAKYPLVCVLKDARTLVSKRGENLYVNVSGNAAMAKAGSGDVLMGMIAGITAQRMNCYDSACLGVYLHGLAGDAARDEKGSYSVLADDIIDGISCVLKKI